MSTIISVETSRRYGNRGLTILYCLNIYRCVYFLKCVLRGCQGDICVLSQAHEQHNKTQSRKIVISMIFNTLLIKICLSINIISIYKNECLSLSVYPLCIHKPFIRLR